MKEDKKAKDNSRIMRRLLDGGSYTTQQIAEQVGLSEKTVRTKMGLINDWLEEEKLGRIERRQGKGIWLAADENQKKRLNQLLPSDQDLKPTACQDSRNKHPAAAGRQPVFKPAYGRWAFKGCGRLVFREEP